MRFSEDHVWVERSGGSSVRVGLTAFAVAELGDISFVELPVVGKHVDTGSPVTSIDSLKSTSDIYAPVSGTVTSVNPLLAREENLSLINEDPMGEGWVFSIEMDRPGEYDELLDESSYTRLIRG